MSNYKLTDNVNETFQFEVAGLKFDFRYPLTDEFEEINEMYIKIREFSEENNKEEAQAVADKLDKKLYALITPVEHKQSIKTVLKKQNVRVLRNFNKMVQTELAIQ